MGEGDYGKEREKNKKQRKKHLTNPTKSSVGCGMPHLGVN